MTTEKFPKGYKAQQRERAKLQAMIEQLSVWAKAFDADADAARARREAARSQARVTEASALRYATAQADHDIAICAADSLRQARNGLRDFLNNPVAKTPNPLIPEA